jgi:TRAP-type C4-dicarboxylate transport system permease small subunit
MIGLIIFEVFMRYVLNRPPIIADEFSAYMLVAMSYLGAAYTFKERGHVRVTALVQWLPPAVSNWLRVVTLAVAFIFSIGLTKSSYDFVKFSFKLHMASATWLNFPLQGPQMTVAIGFTLLSLWLLAEVIKAILDAKSGINIEGKEGKGA